MAKFTKVPTCLIYCLDRNCLQIFTLLLNRWYYWESKDKLIDNKFFAITNEDINQITHLSHRTIIEVISTLYNNNIIEVKSEGKQGKRVPNYYSINWNQIEELDKLELSDLKNKQIKKIARGMSCSYRNDSIIISSKENTTIEPTNNIGSTELVKSNNIGSVNNIGSTEPTNNIGSTNHFDTDFCQNVTLHNIKNNINNNIGPIYNNIITELSFKDNSVIDNNTSNNNSSMTNCLTEPVPNGIKENNNKINLSFMKETILLNKVNKLLIKLSDCDNEEEIMGKINLIGDFIERKTKEYNIHERINEELINYTCNMCQHIILSFRKGNPIDKTLFRLDLPSRLHQYYTSTIEEKVNEADSAHLETESSNNNTELNNLSNEEKIMSENGLNQVEENMVESEHKSISNNPTVEVMDNSENVTNHNEADSAHLETESSDNNTELNNLSNEGKIMLKNDLKQTNGKSPIEGMKLATFEKILSAYNQLVRQNEKTSINNLLKLAHANKPNILKFKQYIKKIGSVDNIGSTESTNSIGSVDNIGSTDSIDSTEPANSIGSTNTPNENGIKDGNTQLLHMRELNHNYDLGAKSYDNNSPYGFVNNVNERFRKNMNLKLHHETLINKYKEDPSFFPNDIIDEYYFLCRLRDGNTPTVEVSNNNSMTFSPLELASILGEDLTDEVEDEEIIDNSTENEPIEEDEDLADEVEEEIIDEESKNNSLELSTFDSVSIEKKSVEEIPTIIDGIDVSGIDVNANYDVQTPNGYVNTLLQSLVKGNINSLQFRQDLIRTNGIYPNFFSKEIKAKYNLQ